MAHSPHPWNCDSGPGFPTPGASAKGLHPPWGCEWGPWRMYLQGSLVSAKSWKPERPLPKLSLQPLGGAFSLRRCLWGWHVTVDRWPEPRRLRLLTPPVLSPLPSPVLRPGLHRPVWGAQQPWIPSAVPQTLQLHLQHPPGGGVPCHPGLRGVL